ncbi:MAG: EpsI family protein [Pseudomonadota bacterium]|nr:EpsI family protein [Pseudomonadota bacterium]
MSRYYRFFIVYVLLFGAIFFVYFHEDVLVPVNRPLVDIPTRLRNWRMLSQARFDENILAVLKSTDYLSRVYIDEERNRVSLYLGYHGGGPESGPIHSPKHCLPGSGWQLFSTKEKELSLEGGQVSMVQAVYQNGDARELFLYWFQVRGESITNEYILKFTEIKNSILYNRRDSAFIRLSVPFEGDPGAVVALGERFLKDFYPEISAVLPE